MRALHSEVRALRRGSPHPQGLQSTDFALLEEMPSSDTEWTFAMLAVCGFKIGHITGAATQVSSLIRTRSASGYLNRSQLRRFRAELQFKAAAE